MNDEFLKNLFKKNISLNNDKDWKNLSELLNRNSCTKEDSTIVEELEKTIKKYNFEDVIKSNFIISSWLPNRSSIYKFHIIDHITVNCLKDEFNELNRIDTYKKFKMFYKEIVAIIPEFPQIEDYIPGDDMGEIKYYFNQKNYLIFYNGGYSNQYEYYSLFELIYSFPKELQKEYGFDFDKDFEALLAHQDTILKLINKYNNNKEIEHNGYIEVPDNKYWINVYENFEKLLVSNNSPLEKWSNPNTIKMKYKDIENSFMQGQSNPLFIKVDDFLFPIFSRSPHIYMFNEYEKYLPNIASFDLYRNIKINLAKYIYNRLGNNIFTLIQSANYDTNNINGKLVYDFGLLTEGTLYLFFTSEIENSKDIEILLKKEKELFIKNNGHFYQQWNFEFNKEMGIQLHYDKIEFINIKMTFNSYFGSYSQDSHLYKIELIKNILFIFDDINNTIEYHLFKKFLLSYEEKSRTIFDRENLWAMFKSSEGEMIKGNETFNMISIYTHTADEYRYDKLKERNKLFKYIPYGNPCEWKVDKVDGKVILQNKYLNDYNEVIRIKNTFIRLNIIPSQFEDIKESEIANFLLMIIMYNFKKIKTLLEKDLYFQRKKELIIKFFPNHITKKKEYQHLHHLNNTNKWDMDFGSFNKDLDAIRIVINPIKVHEFYGAHNTRFEERLIIKDVLKILNVKVLGKIKKTWEKTDKEKSEFRFNSIETPIERNDYHKKWEVEMYYFNKVRKEISLLITKDLNIIEGQYKGKDILPMLYKIRNIVFLQFKEIISEYDTSYIEYFLGELDKVFFINKYEVTKFRQSNTDKIKSENISSDERKTEEHHVFTFIIENKLFLDKFGNKKLYESEAKYIYAFAKWIVVDIYNAIEQIEYDINHEIILNIEKNNLFNLEYPESFEIKMKKWQKYKIESIYKGKDISKVIETEELNEYLDNINMVYVEKYGFNYDKLLYTCNLLYWYQDSKNIIIKINKNELIEYIKISSIKDDKKMEKEEIEKTLDHLELKANLLDTVLKGKTLEHKGFINYGEIKKRPYRLLIKPLIKVGENYYISRETFNTSLHANLRHIHNGSLPYKNEHQEIQKVVDNFSKQIQTKLVRNAYLLSLESGYNKNYVEMEREIYKLDKTGSHVKNLGDYDLLIFDERNNTIFNIECKYISQSFAAKDLKNDLESLFGIKKGYEKSYVGKFMKRQNYLDNNAFELCKNLGYNFKPKIKVVPIFLTYTSNFFLKNPIIETPIIYLTLNEFQEYLMKYKRK